MKNVKLKRIISCIVFAVLLFAAVLKCADVLEYKEAREKYTPFYESKTNFDVIFLGTSHVHNHVLPMEMWKDTGISSYNWGYSNSSPAENYYLIQDIVKYTSPKLVVMDVYGLVEFEKYNNGKYRTDRIEQQHVQFDSLPIWSVNKFHAALDVFDDYAHKEDFLWNFIMYHNRWSELGEGDFNYHSTTQKGASFLKGLGKGRFTPIAEDQVMELDSVCLPYYLKIIEFCQQQGIQVLCVYLPYGSAVEEKQMVANSIGEFLEPYSNCTYVNGLRENILDYETDICPDNSHVNYSGALKITTWLGKYLREHYTLDDYSEDASWQQDYEAYVATKKSTLIKLTALTDCLVQLRDDDFSAEVKVYDQKLMSSERLLLLFQNAGIVPVYVEESSDKCIDLVIKDRNGKVVVDTSFAYTDKKTARKTDIFSINKISGK